MKVIKRPLPFPACAVVILGQSSGQIAEAFMTRPIDTRAEEMFRRQNPGR